MAQSNIPQTFEEIKQYCPYLSENFLQIFEDYAQNRFKKSMTKMQYLYAIASLCNYCKCDFLSLTASSVQNFFTWFQKEADLSTVKYNLRIYRAVSRFIDEYATVYKVPAVYTQFFNSLILPEEEVEIDPNGLPDFQTIDRVFQYAKEKNEMVLFLAMSLALRCSMTIHEITELKKEMFFQDAKGNYGIRMKVSNTTDRFIKIPEDVAIIIMNYISTRFVEVPNLLLNKQNRPISNRSLQNWLRSACIASGVEPFTLNQLRVLSVSHMLKCGVPEEKVADYINVKGTAWFFRYNRVVKELDDSAVDYTHIKIIE